MVATIPPPPHDWIPPGGGVRWTRAGELGWHSLTLPTYLGNHVLAALGEAGGGSPDRLVARADQLADTIAALRPTTGGRS
ncbi:hypothetical protein H8N01_13675 [Streptomyces sp. AC536]|uniref:hypothetical protein n=1 Tax=Streptomyces buecherae TaxID=2763006 RepID=UPI00164DD9AA|nr:hypothetical protein [Streptomyces buecherae]MBC3983579.1 hypothetical protein [Streptomyces buecherae]QNJ40646.1 hypothetical protein H7H31_12960 [Streptomyces buecherae]